MWATLLVAAFLEPMPKGRDGIDMVEQRLLFILVKRYEKDNALHFTVRVMLALGLTSISS